MSEAKKALTLIRDDADWTELARSPMDDHAQPAMALRKRHLRSRARGRLDRGWKVMPEAPGSGSGRVPSPQVRP